MTAFTPHHHLIAAKQCAEDAYKAFYAEQWDKAEILAAVAQAAVAIEQTWQLKRLADALEARGANTARVDRGANTARVDQGV